MAAQLQKLTDITLSGETYHLAANGQAALVSPQGKDAYGNDFAVKVDLVEFLTENRVQKFQDLLDLCARYYRDVQSARDRATGAGRGTQP